MGSKDLNPIDITENNSGRFMSLSVLIHAAMVASVTLMSIPPSNFTPRDVVEFEVESDVSAMTPIPDGTAVPESMGASTPELPQKAAPTTAISAPVVTKTIAPEVMAPTVAEIPVAAEAPKASAPVKSAPVATMPARASAPETLDDIQAPDLETSDLGEVAVAQMDEKDLQEDFEKVDNDNHKTLVAVKNSLEKEAEEAAAEGDTALAEAELENKAQAKAIADALEARRAKDAAAIAAAKASEKAAAQKAAMVAAKEAAAHEAREAQAVAAREAREAREGEEAAARLAALKAESGQGTGNSGSPEPTIEVAGIPGGVRALDQLRQMPGNKFPQYASEERLARQEGKAMFYAYVNKDGSLSQFKLGQTTGHRNLDSKTLAALKKWKFYPGQEGWVEMPFQWTLSGDALEAGGTLRSKR